jgi:hypothetical protein
MARRGGCLGCGAGSLAKLLGVFVVLGLVMWLGALAFVPYAFTLGGHFHWLPFWTGWGRVTSPNGGGEYLIYVSLQPEASNQSVVLTSALNGTAWICTPSGELVPERPIVTMERTWHGPTVGKPVHMLISNYRLIGGSIQTDRRPELLLQGVWADRSLELNDNGTLSAAFLADGSVNRGRAAPDAAQNLKITLNEASQWTGYRDFKRACGAKKR